MLTDGLMAAESWGGLRSGGWYSCHIRRPLIAIEVNGTCVAIRTVHRVVHVGHVRHASGRV